MGWFDILLVRDFCAVRSDFRGSFFFLLLLFDVVYAVNWKGRLRYIYIRIINIWNVQNLAYIKIIFSMNKN